jgi:isoquinoline 1-oxidoreductase beta subunit
VSNAKSTKAAHSRRDFLRGAATASAGLVVAFYLPPKARAAPPPPPPAKPALPTPNAYLCVGADDVVSVTLSKVEMGQGAWTALAMLVADELDADWSKVKVQHGPPGAAYVHTAFGVQITGGSSSTWSEFMRYRQVGAMARDMLVRAAAARWKTDPKKLRTENGFVIKPGKKEERLSYGALALDAEKLTPPKDVKLKDPKEWKLIGKPVRRLDSPEKTTGRAQFGLDVQFPGLRTALVARSPVFGGKVKSVDAAAARAIKGVENVVQVPSGVAVIAQHFWAAKLGRDALKIEWDLGPGEAFDSAAVLAGYRAKAQTPGMKAVATGDVEAGLKSAAKMVVAEYDLPFLSHSPMEPLNCTVKIDGGAMEIWTGTQAPTFDVGAAAAITGIPPEKITLHTPFLGGGFGRRGNPRADFVSEAVFVAKAAGVPVKTVWTREDDIRGGFYRPAFVHRAEVGTGEGGMPVAWRSTSVGQSIAAGTFLEGWMVHGGVDATSVEGIVDNPYFTGTPANLASLHTPTSAVPVLFWRSVGHTHTAFAMESMVDELAAAAGKDPLAYREALLARHPRHLKALQTAAAKAGWGTPPPAGRARGLAVHESFGTIVAECAEVSVDDGRIRVHKVTVAVDCGLAVNPLGIEAQVQSAIVYGLSAALRGEITFAKGRVQQSNFHDYQPLRLGEMPVVAVHLIPSEARMGGIGEPATPPIAPAVANAVFALTQKRLRSLPLRLA